MHRFHKMVVGVAALATASAGVPAAAQTSGEVPVLFDNVAGSRTMVVEDMLGRDLTELDFGEARSLPFRVRVEDKAVGATPFTVNASLTNLYYDNGSGPAYNTFIDSSNVTLSPQTDLGVDVLDVTATLQPVVDLVATLTGPLAPLCALVTGITPIAFGDGCQIDIDNTVGNVVDVPVDLSSLANLPLLPGKPGTGAFTNAEFGAGIGLADPAGDDGSGGRLAGDQLLLASGTPVSAQAVYDALKPTLNALTDDQLITDTAIIAALNDATGGLITKLLSPVLNLIGATVDQILGATTAAVDTLLPDHLLALTG
ncbi:MAG TPA: hypothetical protein VFV35_04390, partial [Acidimicrobiales bacterium]|nr:hypothetical protein [Acidimicrobiales bacterium]